MKQIRVDRYAKVMLTLIAGGLLWLCVRDAPFLGLAEAQQTGKSSPGRDLRADTLIVRRLIVMDENLTMRASLSVDGKSVQLALFDAGGMPRAILFTSDERCRLSLSSKDGAIVRLSASEESTQLTLHGRDAEHTVTIIAGKDFGSIGIQGEGSSLDLTAQRQAANIHLNMRPDSGLSISAIAGHPTITLRDKHLGEARLGGFSSETIGRQLENLEKSLNPDREPSKNSDQAGVLEFPMNLSLRGKNGSLAFLGIGKEQDNATLYLFGRDGNGTQVGTGSSGRPDIKSIQMKDLAAKEHHFSPKTGKESSENKGQQPAKPNRPVSVAQGLQPDTSFHNWFKRGDTRAHVLRVQGQPDGITRYDALGREVWSYGLSRVTFYIESGAVKDWKTVDVQLKSRVVP